MQTITSAGTSIRAVAAVFKKFKFKAGTRNADIGGGKYNDGTEFMKTLGVENLVYDPYNRTYQHNLEVMRRIKDGQSDTVTVANVLNVIREDKPMDEVIAMAKMCVRPGGTVYFQIYEGDKSGVGKETIKGYQRNAKAATYQLAVSKYFKDVTVKGKFLFAK